MTFSTALLSALWVVIAPSQFSFFSFVFLIWMWTKPLSIGLMWDRLIIIYSWLHAVSGGVEEGRMTSQVLMKLNTHQLYMAQFTVSHSSRKQRSGSLKSSLWSFEQTATGEPLFSCFCCFVLVLLCVFHRSWLFISGVSAEHLLMQFSCSENNHSYQRVVFVHLCLCMFSRGVDLPVVCVFLPVGRSVGSHSGHQRYPLGRGTRHRGLLILLYRHLGEWDCWCLFFFH